MRMTLNYVIRKPVTRTEHANLHCAPRCRLVAPRGQREIYAGLGTNDGGLMPRAIEEGRLQRSLHDAYADKEPTVTARREAARGVVIETAAGELGVWTYVDDAFHFTPAGASQPLITISSIAETTRYSVDHLT